MLNTIKPNYPSMLSKSLSAYIKLSHPKVAKLKTYIIE
jgi:hypothetical protein